MGTQVMFIHEVRAAVDHIFAHRKVLRRATVRFQFWPDGLLIACNVPARDRDELAAGRQEIVPWDRLETITRTELVEIIDRVCQPAHDLLGAKGTA